MRFNILPALAVALLCLFAVSPAQAQLVTVNAEYRVIETQSQKQRLGVALPEAAPDKRQNWLYVKATTKFVKRTNLGDQTFRDEVLSYDGFFNTVKKGDMLRVRGGRGWDGTITAKAIYF
jgi:hypothetical protein